MLFLLSQSTTPITILKSHPKGFIIIFNINSYIKAKQLHFRNRTKIIYSTIGYWETFTKRKNWLTIRIEYNRAFFLKSRVKLKRPTQIG